MPSKIPKRKVEILVISDIHLGTYGCHAKELLFYLKSIKPKVIVLNGDIIDIWQFNKKYWPKSHMKIIRYFLNLISKGVKVYYITGNHDETLRRFAGLKLGSLRLLNKLVLDLDNGKKAWFFHGDVFDVTMKHSKWLAKLGAYGYDTLILINKFANFISENVFQKGKLSLSKKIKNSVKSAVKFINDFESVAAEIGINNKYDYVVCGHIHQPEIREIINSKGSILYLNSGDWIENLTSLEYNQGKWSVYHFDHNDFIRDQEIDNDKEEPNNDILFNSLLNEFNILN